MADGKQRIDELAALVKEFGLAEASWESDGLRIAFKKRRPRQLAPRLEGDEFHISDLHLEHESQPEAPPPKVEVPLGSAVTSPMNGIFYNSPSPNASPFVKEGDNVISGQVVGLIEAMKVFNEITSNFSGTVHKVTVETGQVVPAGRCADVHRMTAEKLEHLLCDRIPIAASMALTVVEASLSQVVLEAPLERNVNPHGTAFGGSIGALAVLAGWSLAYIRLQEHGFGDHLVISRTRLDYRCPITGTLRAVCQSPREAAMEKFVHQLKRRGKARLELKVEVLCGETVGANFQGEFVALADDIIEREILRGK